jgi:hypothetical protein
MTACFFENCVASCSPFRFAREIAAFARPTACVAVSFTFAIVLVLLQQLLD